MSKELNTPGSIYFYGSGCKAEENRSLITSILHRYFPDSVVNVEHDLTGAARSLAQNKPAIICILGTGSNSCLYDGKGIVDNMISLGSVLGDEGSGAVMRKELLQKYLYRKLPEELNQAFEKSLDMDPYELLNHVYMKPYPNRFLAKFTRFIHDHRDHPFIRPLLLSQLGSFMQRNILEYDRPDLEVHFLGSIAYYFEAEIREIANQERIRLGNISQEALTGLIRYHREISG
jgi:hypothetical protein